MSNVSIYEKNWTELVFEDRNKAYGAYQLRQENPRTTLLAFFVGTAFVLALIGSWLLLSSFGGKPEEGIVDTPDDERLIAVDLSNPPKPNAPAPIKFKTPPVQTQSLIDPADLSHMVVAATIDAQNNVPTNADIKTPATDNSDGPAGPASNIPVSNGTPGTAVIAVDYSTRTTAQLDRLPEYPGGMKKFYEYVMNSVDESKFENNSGTVSVIMGFVIEKDGSMSDIKVLRSSDKSLEKEAIRVLKSLKVKWTPGILDGEKMRTQYTLPIKVDLK